MVNAPGSYRDPSLERLAGTEDFELLNDV